MNVPQKLTTWLSRLVQIPSVTPVQAGPKSGPGGETAIAAQIATWFQELGGTVEVEHVRPDRPSVYGIWRNESSRWLAVDVHTDTVGVEQMTSDPFSGSIRDGKLWGRGAVDTKASLAIVLALLETIQEQNLALDANLIVGATADEEFGATGTPAFAEWLQRNDYHIDQMVVAEPTECIPVYGHRGVARFHLHIAGEPAHTSQPSRGKNAIAAAVPVIQEMVAEQARLQQVPATELGHGDLTVSMIQGGTGINVVPDSCRVSIDRRVVAGERASVIIDNLVAKAEAACPQPLTHERLREMDPFLQSPDSAWIRQLADWSDSSPQVAPYGTNAWAYRDMPGERVVIGPGSIDQAHGAEEWVEIAELEKMAAIYALWWGLKG